MQHFSAADTVSFHSPLLVVFKLVNSHSDSMTDIASSEQQPAWAASVNPRKDEHASTNDPEAEVRDEWPRRPDSMASSSDRGGHVYSGQGQSQEAAIVLPSDSESDSEDQDTPCSDSSLPSINTIIGTLPAQSQREVASSGLSPPYGLLERGQK